VLNYWCTTPWRRMGKWRYSCTFIDLDPGWEWVVRFMPQAFYPRWKCPQYPLYRTLGGPHSRSGRYTDWAIPAPIKNTYRTLNQIKATQNMSKTFWKQGIPTGLLKILKKSFYYEKRTTSWTRLKTFVYTKYVNWATEWTMYSRTQIIQSMKCL
jgi:hypothetical protein